MQGSLCSDDDGDGIVDQTPCTGGDYGDSTVCVYRPRIHVRDNWGWCTGTCPDDVAGEDGTDGCYGSIEDMDSSDGDNECELDRPDNSAYTEDDPWVYYDGVIVVSP